MHCTIECWSLLLLVVAVDIETSQNQALNNLQIPIFSCDIACNTKKQVRIARYLI